MDKSFIKDKAKSIELLDKIWKIIDDWENGKCDIETYETVNAMIDEAGHLCPHDGIKKRKDLDTDEIWVEECDDCGIFIYHQYT